MLTTYDHFIFNVQKRMNSEKHFQQVDQLLINVLILTICIE